MAAKNKPIRKMTAADLGLSGAELAPRQKICRVYVPPKKAVTEFFEGSAKDIAARLVDKLKNEARLL
jgi:electron transfer flavoprotein beta subunit